MKEGSIDNNDDDDDDDDVMTTSERGLRGECRL